jgi:hypothetical protein
VGWVEPKAKPIISASYDNGRCGTSSSAARSGIGGRLHREIFLNAPGGHGLYGRKCIAVAPNTVVKPTKITNGMMPNMSEPVTTVMTKPQMAFKTASVA